ncbi:MAG: cob(I)yrinic acid a,c-diamide adenosyltransferase [Thermotogota bacterium]|nr:cob(I)yrinic acid a,c-diamide adenosyltransferase [Thermotogota bacterium]
MSISTGRGDKGKTSLWSGEEVFKDDLRVESYGTVDELNSFLGKAKHECASAVVKNAIHNIQKDLFKVSSELASKNNKKGKLINKEDIESMKNQISYYETKIDLKGFVVPGLTAHSASIDICRTIARRAERRIVSLSRDEDISENLLKYINKLSDLLYLLARYEDKIV